MRSLHRLMAATEVSTCGQSRILALTRTACWAVEFVRSLAGRTLILGWIIVLLASPGFGQNASEFDLSKSSRTKHDAVAIELTRFGFSPRKVVVQTGRILIFLKPFSNVEGNDVTISIRKRNEATTVAAQNLTKKSLGGQRLYVTLTPGTYEIISPQFPNSVVALIVTERKLSN